MLSEKMKPRPEDVLAKHEAFEQYARDNGISLKEKEDWEPWYKCWEDGYKKGEKNGKM